MRTDCPNCGAGPDEHRAEPALTYIGASVFCERCGFRTILDGETADINRIRREQWLKNGRTSRKNNPPLG